jgi:PHD/YefM family antitoxin component YafN of YafNO toxin-antitoxin module
MTIIVPANVRSLPRVGVAKFRANPLAAVGGGPVVVENHGKPALVVLPVESDDDSLLNLRFQARMEAIRAVLDDDAVREDLEMLRAVHDNDETLAEVAARLGL